jgi:hypothetical protein
LISSTETRAKRAPTHWSGSRLSSKNNTPHNKAKTGVRKVRAVKPVRSPLLANQKKRP